MPYQIHLHSPPDDALDRLVELGALDVDLVDGGIAAVMPDAVDLRRVEDALRTELRLAPAQGRDDDSVWVVRPRPVHVGRWQLVPAQSHPQPGGLRLIDGRAFGTGLHATTALCLEALDDELRASRVPTLLDVGTGTGVLALAALHAGVPHAVAIDVDGDAVRVAAANARLNALTSRLTILHGGADALSGTWPLVLANVLAAPLIAMAPTLSRRVGRSGRMVLSGIRSSIARDVEQAYSRVGMRQVGSRTRDGWTALTLHASW